MRHSTRNADRRRRCSVDVLSCHNNRCVNYKASRSHCGATELPTLNYVWLAFSANSTLHADPRARPSQLPAIIIANQRTAVQFWVNFVHLTDLFSPSHHFCEGSSRGSVVKTLDVHPRTWVNSSSLLSSNWWRQEWRHVKTAVGPTVFHDGTSEPSKDQYMAL